MASRGCNRKNRRRRGGNYRFEAEVATIAQKIRIDDLTAVIDNFIRDAAKMEQTGIEEKAEEVATACAEELRRTSPRSEETGNHYADGWIKETIKKGDINHHIVKNPKHGRLTGLLENGTGLRKTRKGHHRGIMPPNPHFVVAARNAIMEMERTYGK